MRDYSKILVCLDLSEGSERIAERAQCIAKRYGASLTLLHVVEYVPVEPMGETLLPDKISIYMGEFLRGGYRGKELVEEIRLTIFHEIGHYFGLDDAALEELESS